MSILHRLLCGFFRAAAKSLSRLHAAGDLRPIDYEYFYEKPGVPLKVANAGFALYRLPDHNGQEVYAFRAEDFIEPSKYEGEMSRGAPPLRSFFTVFSVPDCRYWGVIRYDSQRHVRDVERINGDMRITDSY